MCSEVHAQLQAQIRNEVHSLREELLKERQASLKREVDEYFYDPNNTTVSVTPQSKTTEIITSLMCYLPASDGTITLGERTIPVAQGFTLLNDLRIRLNDQEKRKLTQTSATKGQIFLELFGYEVPINGVY